MDSDRELLELAAKAVNGGSWHPLTHDTPNGAWNPLADDGDAFRLAVKLGLTVQRAFDNQRVHAGLTHSLASEPLGDDLAAATRRAIVRAAAALGKEMP